MIEFADDAAQERQRLADAYLGEADRFSPEVGKSRSAGPHSGSSLPLRWHGLPAPSTHRLTALGD